jgi:hypothetical protein
MALRLVQASSIGISCDYWRVLVVHYDARTNSLTAEVGLYVSEAARDSGAEPAEMKTFSGLANVEPSGLADANIFVKVYDMLKELPMFQGAVDC